MKEDSIKDDPKPLKRKTKKTYARGSMDDKGDDGRDGHQGNFMESLMEEGSTDDYDNGSSRVPVVSKGALRKQKTDLGGERSKKRGQQRVGIMKHFFTRTVTPG